LASVRARTGAPPLRTFTLITTEANAVVGRIHDRMPVMLNTLEERAAWLNERTPLSEIRSLLGPAPDALVSARRVSRAVSNARNEGPRLLDEIPDESVGLGL
ncbi:MAG: SOS response-associated peptidase family protein, partial [Candidatus Limnocylindrus sp.]